MSFIGNEVLPYMMDAVEQKIDISVKTKAITYLEPEVPKDKFIGPVVKYLKSIDDSEYKELLKLVKGYTKCR